jgi:hypothetical protein
MDGRRKDYVSAVASDIEPRSNRAGAIPDDAIFAPEEDMAAARRNAFHRRWQCAIFLL